MWSTPSRNVALAASELGPTWNTALATPAFGERYSSRSVANGAVLLTVPSARLSCSSMYAWTAVPDGYGLSVPSVTSVAVARPFGGTDGGSMRKLLRDTRQTSGVAPHGLATPCSAAPPRGIAGAARFVPLSG